MTTVGDKAMLGIEVQEMGYFDRLISQLDQVEAVLLHLSPASAARGSRTRLDYDNSMISSITGVEVE
jgi:hypothetical protein